MTFHNIDWLAVNMQSYNVFRQTLFSVSNSRTPAAKPKCLGVYFQGENNPSPTILQLRGFFVLPLFNSNLKAERMISHFRMYRMQCPSISEALLPLLPPSLSLHFYSLESFRASSASPFFFFMYLPHNLFSTDQMRKKHGLTASFQTAS